MSRLIKTKDIVIYKNENTYNHIPNVISQNNDTIVVSFRQAKERQKQMGATTHIDPTGTAVCVTSKDNGKTWEKEVRTIYDDFLDGIEDISLNILTDGTAIGIFYKWKVYHAEDIQNISIKGLANKFYGKYIGVFGGSYSIRSNDDGNTWDEPIPVTVKNELDFVATRGKVLELDNAILLPVQTVGDNAETETSRCVLMRSMDKGKNWEYYSQIAKLEDYNLQEPNIYQTESGKIVAFIRAEQKKASLYNSSSEDIRRTPLITCESFDNGKTWTEPIIRKICTYNPFHPLRLRSGKVLLPYGYRYKPYGLRAVLLDSECNNIDDVEEIILRIDGLGWDIGYASAVELSNNNILIVYNYYGKDGIRYIAGTFCKEID